MAKLILWAVLIVLLIRAVSRLLRGVLQGAGYTRNPAGPPSVALVKDPVCGVFVAPTTALMLGSGPDTKFFCSEKCRQAWKHAS
jgi:YHS domain-containing protein